MDQIFIAGIHRKQDTWRLGTPTDAKARHHSMELAVNIEAAPFQVLG